MEYHNDVNNLYINEEGVYSVKREDEYILYRDDERYPEKLRTIPNAPTKLYVRGRLPDENKPSVAIIGARACSTYGEDMAKWFAVELARRGVQIISGMARGIDGISQWAALKVGGESFGVLGCGTDVCYPPENRGVYEALLKTGGIISEFSPGTQPLSRNFPSRNRIISGLADLVLVIEARERSGTLHTVDYALAQGKDVYALPGRLGDPKSAGCNGLIHMGAGLALTPADILEALGIEPGDDILSPRAAISYMRDSIEKKDNLKKENLKKENLKKAVRTLKNHGELDMPGTGAESPPKAIYELGAEEKPVWNALTDSPQKLQTIYDRLMDSGEKCSFQDLINILMNLVIKGAASTKEGSYCRCNCLGV